MSIANFFFFLGVLLILISFFIKKERKIISRRITLLAIIFLFGPFFLPRAIFGKWNAIKDLNGKHIQQIILEPSLPDWKVNLTDNSFIITSTMVIDTLSKLLSETQAYFPNHPMQIWETSVVIVTNEKDTLKLNVSKTKNNGTVVSSQSGEYRKDNLDEYLERLTFFKEPAFSKDSQDKHN